MNFFGDIFLLEEASIVGKIKHEVGKKAIWPFIALVPRGQLGCERLIVPRFDSWSVKGFKGQGSPWSCCSPLVRDSMPLTGLRAWSLFRSCSVIVFINLEFFGGQLLKAVQSLQMQLRGGGRDIYPAAHICLFKLWLATNSTIFLDTRSCSSPRHALKCHAKDFSAGLVPNNLFTFWWLIKIKVAKK